MSKKLTVEQIKDKRFEIECRYHKGWRESEYWWRVCGDVHPTDRRLWTRYTNLLNERKQKSDNER